MLGTSPILEKPAASSPKTGDKLLMNQDNAVKQIDYDALATAILNKLSSQNFSSLSTSAKTVLGAVNELNSKSFLLSGGTAISSNSDMNNYTEIGNYYANSEIAQSLQNAPFNRSFTMKIDYGNGTGYICQTYREIDTGRVAIRYNNNQVANAGQWQDYAFFSSDESLSHIYSLSGIGWKRVLKFEGASISAAGGSVGYGGLISIKTSYSNDANMYDLIAFAARYYTNAESNFKKLHGIGNEVITKIRHTVDSETNTAYIEVYYNSAYMNVLNVNFIDNSCAQEASKGWEPTNGESTAETVDGVSVVSTLDLTSA